MTKQEMLWIADVLSETEPDHDNLEIYRQWEHMVEIMALRLQHLHPIAFKPDLFKLRSGHQTEWFV